MDDIHLLEKKVDTDALLNAPVILGDQANAMKDEMQVKLKRVMFKEKRTHVDLVQTDMKAANPNLLTNVITN